MHWQTEVARLLHSLGLETERPRLTNFWIVRSMPTEVSPRVYNHSPLELETEPGCHV